MMCNATAAWRAHRKGALFANPCYTQIHPTCIPASTSSSRSSRSCPSRFATTAASGCQRNSTRRVHRDRSPKMSADYYLERRYPAFGNLVPRDVASRAASARSTPVGGIARFATACTSTSPMPSGASEPTSSQKRYGNLFDIYERITDEDPYKVPMRIYPATHYTMGGLWVDYNLMTNVPGLYCLGEANFSDHGANRLAPLPSCKVWPTGTSCCRTRSATTCRRCSAQSQSRLTTQCSPRRTQRSPIEPIDSCPSVEPDLSTGSTASLETGVGLRRHGAIGRRARKGAHRDTCAT